MRLWHYKLLPYLPDAQFKGQLREVVAIMHVWRDEGQTNHLLINRVMEYPKTHLTAYFLLYRLEYTMRYKKDIKQELINEFVEFASNETKYTDDPFIGWHNDKYLKVCLSNIYEKHHFGIGKSRITEYEWKRLCEGYKIITGENYSI